MKQNKQQQPIELEHMVRRREIPLWGWLAVIAYMVLVDNLMPSEYEGWALVAGWFAAGGMYFVNYSSCGRISLQNNWAWIPRNRCSGSFAGNWIDKS